MEMREDALSVDEMTCLVLFGSAQGKVPVSGTTPMTAYPSEGGPFQTASQDFTFALLGRTASDVVEYRREVETPLTYISVPRSGSRTIEDVMNARHRRSFQR